MMMREAMMREVLMMMREVMSWMEEDGEGVKCGDDGVKVEQMMMREELMMTNWCQEGKEIHQSSQKEMRVPPAS
jgi:hypothetical protein